MTLALDDYFRQLDRKELPSDVHRAAFAFGKDGYEYLLRAISAPGATDRQVANALHLLFELRTHGDPAALFETTLNLMLDARQRVRSAATKLAIGSVMHADRVFFGDLYAQQRLRVIANARKGLTLGLDRDAAALTKSLLT